MARRESQGPKTPVERLIEAGLAAYGRGEVDDALVAWEQALVLAPEDTRALGYVDYVRQHYELVSGSQEPVAEEELGVPFGIGDDDGDYEIEVTLERPRATDGETVRLSSPPLLDPVDEGWSLEEDVLSRARTIDSPGLTLELEADEPPEDFELDRTAEYAGGPGGPRKRQPGPSSPGFLPSEHPTEPGTDEFPSIDATTGVGQRALGFVQPRETKERVRRPDRPELKVNIRTPEERDTLGDIPPIDPEHTAALSLDHVPERAPSEGDDDALGPALGEEVATSKTPTLDFGSKSEGPTRDLGERSARAKASTTARLTGAPRPASGIAEAAARAAATAARDLRAPTLEDEIVQARTRTQEARSRVLAEVDRHAVAGETTDQRTRRRIAALIELAQQAAKLMQLERAVIAIDAAFTQDPDSAVGHKLIQQNREAIFSVIHDFLGDLDRRPRLSRALHDVVDEPLDSRAAFLLSRVDGTLTYEELLDVSGMPRLEAGRYLCQLLMRGLLTAE